MIRTFFSKTDIKQLTEYNQYVEQVKKGIDGAKEKLDEFGSSMTNTAQAAAKAANGGVVALDKLNKGFNWAALGAAALNAAVNTAIALIGSLLITALSNYIHRVEIAHQKTAEVISGYQDSQSKLTSLKQSLNDNYDQLRKLDALKRADNWDASLKAQYEQLQKQTQELEWQLELERQKATYTQRDVADALTAEADTTASSEVYVSVGQYGQYYSSQTNFIKSASRQLTELNEIIEDGDELTEDQISDYQELSRALTDIALQRQEWIKQGDGNQFLTTELNEWRNTINQIRNLLNPDLSNYYLPSMGDVHDYIQRSISKLKDGRDQALYNEIYGSKKSDLLSASSYDSRAYDWILTQANTVQISVEEYINALVELGIVTDDITDSNDKFNASLLETAKAANNDLEAAAAAFEALESAVNDYNDAGYITDETLDSLNSKVPGAVEALFNENGALKENAAEALKSTSALITFVRAQLQAQLTAAQANYDNLKQELDDIQQKGLDAAAAMLGVQAAQDGLDAAKKNLADFEAWMKSGIFKSGSGGGGGSKSIYSKEYEQITDLTEHYIKMSEMRQKRMNEESSEYKAESRQQFLYYQQLAEQTYAEISRLRAKGYTEANADFRKLLQNYESYLGSMQDHSRLRGEQCYP